MSTEDPMIEDRMALAELLQKSGEADTALHRHAAPSARLMAERKDQSHTKREY